PAVLELKGDVLSSLGRRPEALAAYEAAQALDPSNGNVKQKIEEVRVDVPGLLSRALIASASGNYAQALNLFDDILEVEPSNVNALIGKAVAYRRSGKLQEALNCLDLVLNIQPNNAAALLNRGNLLVERGDFDAALETYDKLVTLAPADEEAWAAQADVFVRVGRDDDALRAYAEALKLNPGDEEIPRKIRELEESRSVHADVLRELYKVKGIGPARAKALVDAGFKTAEDFHHATAEQLLAVKGITKRIAEDLVKHFKGALVEAR
ncbi:MAG: tetratricopeptide repeat protein, partial [Candidatus Thermoplasmatota archaeon]